MAKKSKKSIYKCGGKMANGGDVAQTRDPNELGMPQDLSQYSGLANMTGSLLENSNSPIGTIGGGILKGAGTGAALGPIGAGVGAVLGGIGGVMKNKQNNEAEEMQKRMLMQQSNMQSLQNFQNANKMYALGGQLGDPPYTTKLTPEEQKQFNAWYSKISKYKQLNPNPDDLEQQYDYRGYWKNEKNRDDILKEGTDAHFIDKYKMPGHPTFSNESMYSSDKTPGGSWTQDNNGKWYFHHSPYTSKNAQSTEQYLRGSGDYSILGNDTIKGPEYFNNQSKLTKKYAQGGNLNVNPLDNQITQYNGLTHDEGGLPLGENTEVESGETRGTMNTSDYIFSDSLRPDRKSKKTFADISKSIEKKYKNYNTDEFAIKAKDVELSKLMYEQEAFKKNKLEDGIQKTWAKYGGPINKLPNGGNIENDPFKTNNPDSTFSANKFISSIQEPWYNKLNAYEAMLDMKKDNVNYQKGYSGGQEYAKNNMILSNQQVLDFAKQDQIPDNVKKALSIMDLKRIESIKSKMRFGGNIMDIGGPIDPPTGLPEEDPNNPNYNKYTVRSVDKFKSPEELQQHQALMKNLHGLYPQQFTNETPTQYAFDYLRNPEVSKKLTDKNLRWDNKSEETLGYYYPSIENTPELMVNLPSGDRENVMQKRLKTKFPITTSQFASNPEAYRDNMDLNEYNAYLRYIKGQEYEVPTSGGKLTRDVVLRDVQNAINTEGSQNKGFKYGGKMQMPYGGGLSIDKIQSPQFNFNLSPETQMNQDLFNKYKQQNNNSSGNDPEYSYSKSTTQTPVGLSDTKGGIYDSKLSGINPINYNTNGSYWNQSENIGKSFTPESIYNYMTKDLGIDPSFAKQMTSDPKLMQGYFEFAEQAPEDFFNKRKELYPKYSKNEALGDKNRFGQHHQWTLDPKMLQSYQEYINFTPPNPIESLGPPTFQTNHPPIPPQGWKGEDFTGGPPSGLEKNNPPQDNGGPPQGGVLKPFGPDWVASGVSMLPNIGMGIGNLALANNLNFDRTNAEIMNPDYVDPTRAIQETRNQYSGAKDLIRQNSGSTGSYLSNILGATAGQSEAESGVQSQYDNTNAGIYNQSAQFNTQNKQRANEVNANIQMQEMMQKTNLKQQGYQNLSDAANTGINTYYQSKRDADKMNLAGGENFYYKRIGSLANQKPVKVFKGNGYHYYEDPSTGQLRFLDEKTGKQVKSKDKISEYAKDINSSKVSTNNAQANKSAELQFAFSQMTPEQKQQFLQNYTGQ